MHFVFVSGGNVKTAINLLLQTQHRAVGFTHYKNCPDLLFEMIRNDNIDGFSL